MLQCRMPSFTQRTKILLSWLNVETTQQRRPLLYIRVTERRRDLRRDIRNLVFRLLTLVIDFLESSQVLPKSTNCWYSTLR